MSLEPIFEYKCLVNMQVYALKKILKAPLGTSKHIEHVLNERAVLEDADHPFLVGFKGAYQDNKALYLLQVGVVWVYQISAYAVGSCQLE